MTTRHYIRLILKDGSEAAWPLTFDTFLSAWIYARRYAADRPLPDGRRVHAIDIRQCSHAKERISQ